MEILRQTAIETCVEKVFDILSWLKNEVLRARAGAIETDLGALRARANRIRALLEDAEQRRHIEDKSVILWLADLRAVAFDVEDLVDEFETRARLVALPKPTTLWYQHQVAGRIAHIDSRYGTICKDRRHLRLEPTRAVVNVREPVPHHTSSLRGTSQFYGRFKEKGKLIALLREPLVGKNGVPVISIIGFGGMGKTALAQSIFEDNCVVGLFNLWIWICVRQDSDVMRTTKQIIESITKRECHFSTMDMLQRHLKQLVHGRRFLLILDSVWTEDPRFWETLQVPLTAGDPGSKVLITTRSKEVSRKMCEVASVPLGGLDVKYCWSVFRDRAFTQEAGNEPQNFVDIGMEIVKKCSGSPLAASLLGIILHNLPYEQWVSVLNDMPDPEDVVDNFLPVLKPSYDLLPLHLKRCFAYCSIFPKDYVFDKDELIKLWMAEGLIKLERPRENKQLEDLGIKHFDSLLWRSFFQPCDSNQKHEQKYIMPSMIHDLAQSVSKYECLRVNHIGVQHGEQGRARYALLCLSHMEQEAFKKIYDNKTLRTLILYNESSVPLKQVPTKLFEKLTCLRALDLSNSLVENLPHSVGSLIHLRYLSLSGTRVRNLPESVCKLYNLQTLELDECYKLQELPKGMGSLVNLRHIGLHLDWEFWDRGTDLVSMPQEIGRLTALQTLSRFSVASSEGCGISELRNLNLRGELCISKLENVINAEDAEQAKLSEKQHIHSIMLRWGDRTSSLSQEGGGSKEVIKRLRPHNRLKYLWIEKYNGKTFPPWLEDSSFSSLETLRLSKCKDCVTLPCLGKLPRLRSLYIEGLHKVRHMGYVLPGIGGAVGFQSLESLTVSDMPDLETWYDIREGAMAQLSQLIISNCPKLTKLCYLPLTLSRFELRNCPRLMTLPKLPSLHDLEVEGCNWAIIGWFSEVTSLSSLTLSLIPELKRMPNSYLKCLPSLRKLKIEGCSELESLAKHEGLQNLSSLRYLEIFSCPKLTSLPELPADLQYLAINGCPTLQHRCRENGPDWPKINRVPYRHLEEIP